MKIITACIIALVVNSCSTESNTPTDFYSSTKDADLWRVPLIEPYEVVSPTNSELNDWFIILKNPKISGPDFTLFGDEFQFTNITLIGIQDSIIVVENTDHNWPALSGAYSSVLLINSKTNECFIYSKEHHSDEINSKYDELGVEKIKLYSWSTLKNDFLENNKLPNEWRK